MRNTNLYSVATLIVAWLGASSLAIGQVPSINGTIYHDLNWNNATDSGEEISGVSLTLYADDGDGLFDSNTDAVAGSMVSGAGGAYSFGGLNAANNYFVYQSAQSVGSVILDSSVSNLLDPTTLTMMIDAFDDQQVVQGNPVNTIGASNLTSSSVIGGQRDLMVEYLAGGAEAVLHANPYGLTDVLQFDQSAGVQAIATVTWDGVDNDMSSTPAANGLGGMDLSGSEAFAFNTGIDAAGAGEMLTLRIFSGTDVSTATVEIPVTNGLATSYQIVDFSEFSGAASFSNVDAFQIEVGGAAPSLDFQLGPITLISGTTQDLLVVPEPSAGLMGVISFLGLMVSRRRRQR